MVKCTFLGGDSFAKYHYGSVMTMRNQTVFSVGSSPATHQGLPECQIAALIERRTNAPRFFLIHLSWMISPDFSFNESSASVTDGHWPPLLANKRRKCWHFTRNDHSIFDGINASHESPVRCSSVDVRCTREKAPKKFRSRMASDAQI